MDEIDITSAEFSLDIHNTNKLVSETIENMSDKLLVDEDYSMYIIGMVVFLLLGGFFAYTFYTNKKTKRVTFQDKLDYCYGQGKDYDDIECNGGVCQRL